MNLAIIGLTPLFTLSLLRVTLGPPLRSKPLQGVVALAALLASGGGILFLSYGDVGRSDSPGTVVWTLLLIGGAAVLGWAVAEAASARTPSPLSRPDPAALCRSYAFFLASLLLVLSVAPAAVVFSDAQRQASVALVKFGQRRFAFALQERSEKLKDQYADSEYAPALFDRLATDVDRYTAAMYTDRLDLRPVEDGASVTAAPAAPAPVRRDRWTRRLCGGGGTRNDGDPGNGSSGRTAGGVRRVGAASDAQLHRPRHLVHPDSGRRHGAPLAPPVRQLQRPRVALGGRRIAASALRTGRSTSALEAGARERAGRSRHGGEVARPVPAVGNARLDAAAVARRRGRGRECVSVRVGRAPRLSPRPGGVRGCRPAGAAGIGRVAVRTSRRSAERRRGGGDGSGPSRPVDIDEGGAVRAVARECGEGGGRGRRSFRAPARGGGVEGREGGARRGVGGGADEDRGAPFGDRSGRVRRRSGRRIGGRRRREGVERGGSMVACPVDLPPALVATIRGGGSRAGRTSGGASAILRDVLSRRSRVHESHEARCWRLWWQCTTSERLALVHLAR